MITDISDCTVQETHDHIQYLKREKIPVLYNDFRIADMLEQGTHVLKKGNIGSISCLGSMPTIFCELDGIKAIEVFGRKEFLVGEVMSILKRPDCHDKSTLKSIERFMREDAAGRLELKITVIHVDADYRIADGHKRAVAFFERGARTPDYNMRFPIFLVEPSTSLSTPV